ncbi:hypothetical protein HALLA_18080 [Halostagnicola larsenii XH-48]|uniref:Uncharacterized protein n=1 Tax=Halostagnicola larsenii XH-48 TaxID=797299 RepID=W0JRA7_9EURY|nr:hypothetical protein [Halostagnicola larsenii]AHG01149.1 hypothetical protein HALLA_18080 [Halostagnicola larsenii XH-48]
MNSRFALALVGFGLFVLWAIAVLAFVLGRYTPVPLLSGVHHIVAAGAVVLTFLGAISLVRTGYHRIVD